MKNDEKDYPNIILIVIDALRSRNLGCYGGDANLSPHIDAIAKKSILFENCYSCWNTTDQSLTSILTGRYPRTHGIIHHGDKIAPEDLNTFERLNVKLLSEPLYLIGYKNFAVDWMGRWFKRGFDFYGYRLKQNIFQKLIYTLFTLPYVHIRYMAANVGFLKIYAKKRKDSLTSLFKSFRDIMRTFRFTFELARIQDAAFVTKVTEHLVDKVEKEPFFLFLHFWDTHTPYNCPKKYITGRKEYRSPADFFTSKYQGAVSYVDTQIGRMLDFLRQKKLLDNTLIIITSDHGESLTEHEIFFDHHGLYEVTTHVPFIVYYPRIFKHAKRIKGLVQHIDLAPTLFDLLGIEYKNFGLDGKSLMPLITGEKKEIREYALFEESYVQKKIGLRTSKFKYIYAPDGVGICNYCQKVHAGIEEFYDLENDPEETINKVHSHKEALEMRRYLIKIVQELDKKKKKELELGNNGGRTYNHPQDLKESKKLRKKLKSLGYMD